MAASIEYEWPWARGVGLPRHPPRDRPEIALDLPRAKSREARGMGGRRGCESLSSGLEKMRSSIGYADVFGVCQRPLLSRTVHRRSHTNRAAAHSTCMCLYTLLRHVCVSNCEPTFAAVCEGTWPWQSLCGQSGTNPFGRIPYRCSTPCARAHAPTRTNTTRTTHNRMHTQLHNRGSTVTKGNG